LAELREHPFETVGLVVAGLAMARLAFTPSKKKGPALMETALAARRRSRH
jgi:hypothetical protein